MEGVLKRWVEAQRAWKVHEEEARRDWMEKTGKEADWLKRLDSCESGVERGVKELREKMRVCEEEDEGRKTPSNAGGDLSALLILNNLDECFIPVSASTIQP